MGPIVLGVLATFAVVVFIAIVTVKKSSLQRHNEQEEKWRNNEFVIKAIEEFNEYYLERLKSCMETYIEMRNKNRQCSNDGKSHYGEKVYFRFEFFDCYDKELKRNFRHISYSRGGDHPLLFVCGEHSIGKVDTVAQGFRALTGNEILLIRKIIVTAVVTRCFEYFKTQQSAEDYDVIHKAEYVYWDVKDQRREGDFFKGTPYALYHYQYQPQIWISYTAKNGVKTEYKDF